MKDSADIKETKKRGAYQEKFGENGIKAMQGLGDDSSTSVDIWDVEKQSRIEGAAHRADVNIPKRSDGDFAQIHEFYELSGRAGEELAEVNTPGSVNLNDILEKPNVPNYDIASPEGLASVKVMRAKEGEPRYSTYDYHFRNMINPESRKNRLFAKELANLQDSDPKKWRVLSQHLPSELANAVNEAQFAKASAGNSMLMISPDQVRKVREDLAIRIKKEPKRYGLDEKMTNEDVKAFLKKRIQPFDPTITANSIDASTVLSMNRRHEKQSLWTK